MDSFKKEQIQEQLLKLLEKAPENSFSLFVLDSELEVDEVKHFKDGSELYNYLWDNLHTVPVAYVLKSKKFQRVGYRLEKQELVLTLDKKQVVSMDFYDHSSVSKKGNYKFLN